MNQPSSEMLSAAEQALYQPIENNDRDNVYKALNRVMRQVGYVKKTGKNSFHNYSYASERDVIEALRPHLVEEGLVFTQNDTILERDEQGNTHMSILWEVMHAPTSTSFLTWTAGSGNDRNKNGTIGDKGVYKAQTGNTKYLLMKLFLIPTGDDAEETNAAESEPEIAPIKVDWPDWYDKVSSSIAACEDMDGLRSIIDSNKEQWSSLVMANDLELVQIRNDYAALLKTKKRELTEQADESDE